MPGNTPNPEGLGLERRFACTACGKCCNSGPEMELSEAAALADKFVFSLYFRIWDLPLARRRQTGPARTRRSNGSPIGDRELEAHRNQLAHFSVRERIDRAKGRSRHLTMSARTIDREAGRCPALVDARCAIYERRPLSCRAVPLHFSQPDASLGRALDAFVRLPGHLCDTSSNAPLILDGAGVIDSEVARARYEAVGRAKSDRPWKEAILALMDNPHAAAQAGLPTFDSVLRQADSGFASSVSMLVAWRVASDIGILPKCVFAEICDKQIQLLKGEAACAANLDLAGRLAPMLSEYEAARADLRPALPLLSAAPPRSEIWLPNRKNGG